MEIIKHWALMAAIGTGLMSLTFNYYQAGWQSLHWLYAILAPAWIYMIIQLYRTDWDSDE